ncbi:MAG TPA: ATP-binding protein [Burkholderiales bacterium]|nr:ATP-binding protein [Burkholderiales bacterium]
MALSLRARLLWLVGVALLPVALFALVSLIALGQQQRAQAQQALVERARAMASAVDQELQGSVAALEVLALSRSLDAGDLRRFHADARAAAGARATWDGILLTDLEGKWLLSTRIPYGAPMPGRGTVVEPGSFAALVAGGRPVVGSIARGPRGRFLFPVRVAVARGGQVRYVLTALVDPADMLGILERQKVPPQSVVTIFDGSQNIVARSRGQSEFAGTPLSATLRALMGDAGEGWGLTRTREGEEVYTAFSRAGPGAWGVALGVEMRALERPISRSYAVSGAGLLLSLAAGGLAAVLLARRISATLAERAALLSEANAGLRASNEQLEAFSYSVSHDLRAPLRAVDANASLVLEAHGAALPAEAQERLRKVSASAQYLARLIDALLAFSQLARRPVERQRVEPAALVEECVRVLRGERTAQVLVGELPACAADPQLLRQVFHHLIENAFKYSAVVAAPRVEIGWDDGEGAYTVRDNGAGFDMQFAGKLFGLFERLHSPGEYDGTGLGLAIVQRIVQRHGGRVWAEAAPGKGATFYFTLGA